MGSRSLNVAILLFWLSTMSWLTVAKIVPALRTGEPPNYRSILASQPRSTPVCWSILLEGRPLGWAASNTEYREDGLAQMYSRIFFRELPIEDVAPRWFAAVIRPLLDRTGPLDMEAVSRLDIDPLGRLIGFESRVRVAQIEDAVAVQGELEGNQLRIKVQSGDAVFHADPNAMVGDALSPQTRLPGLRLGQRWTMPVYSPFRPARSAMEIIEAKVERAERILWDGRMVDTLLVVYRADSGSGPGVSRETRGKLWVRSDGVVLKQEVKLFNSRIQFARLPARQARAFTASLTGDWSQGLPPREAERLFARLYRRTPVE